MHLALASEPDDKEYAPEPFTPFYQRALYQSMRNLATENFELLKKAHKSLPAHQIDPVDRVLLQEKEILKRFESVFKPPSSQNESAATATSIWARCCTPERIL